ncbi:MAG: hypothetical protein AAGG81_08550, partial [Chlamydiota bacterium]
MDINSSMTVLNLCYNGIDGLCGEPGRCGDVGESHFSERNGRIGKPGTPGLNGKIGTDAGNCDIILGINETSKKILLYVENSSYLLPLGNPESKVVLTARGGTGGSGGKGGTGGAGGRGTSGCSANKSTSGTNGGNGGNGGPGGIGGHGANGGKGGHITVTVDESNTDLLMLFPQVVDVSGGIPGISGKGGEGGKGGERGYGGSSYSWTEEKVERHWNGQCYSETRRRIPHTTSGGYSGNTGLDGVSGNNGTAGLPGENGSHTIKVITPSGKEQEYPTRFHLEITSVNILTPEFYPGDLVNAEVTLKNTGLMPTPTHQKIYLYVTSSETISFSEVNSVALPGVLDPGETCKEKVQFMINKFPLKNTSRYECNVEFNTIVERVNKCFSPFQLKLDINHPVIINQISMPEKASDQALNHFSLKVQNVSSKPLNANVLISPKQDSVVPKEEMIFTSSHLSNSKVSSEFFAPIFLEPNGISILEGTLSFSPQLDERCSIAKLTTTLSLQTEENVEELFPVQQIDSTINVSTPFSIPKNAEHLIVTNKQTTRAEVVSWTKIIAGIGYSEPAIWNVSNRGTFHPSAITPNFADKTIIVLNNYVDSKTEKGYHTVDRIAKDEFFNAIKYSGLKLYILGAPIESISYCQLPKYTPPIPLIKENEVISRLRKEEGPFCFTVYSKIKKGKSSKPKLTSKVDHITKKLLEKIPEKRYIVCHKYEPPQNFSMIGCSKKLGIGTVLIYEALPKNHASTIVWDVGKINLPHPEYNIPHHSYNLIKLHSFEKKMALILHDLEQPREDRLLEKAILSDLVDEVSVA